MDPVSVALPKNSSKNLFCNSMSGGSDPGNRKQIETKNKMLDNGEELKVHLPLKQQRETLLC